MFAGVISRDDGEPWGPTGMSSIRWFGVPTRVVAIDELIATQPGVLFHGLRDDAPTPVGGDEIPHVISWHGRLYLEDGHHRVVRRRLAGGKTVQARVLEVED